MRKFYNLIKFDFLRLQNVSNICLYNNANKKYLKQKYLE